MTEGSLRPHTAQQHQKYSTHDHPPLTTYRLASFTTPRPRVLRLAHILPRRHVISFIKYGGVEAVRGDREYCGLEPGRQASSDNGMPCTAHSREYQDILTELGSVL